MVLTILHATAVRPLPTPFQVEEIRDATVVVEDDRIVSVTAGTPAPAGAEVIDAGGRLLTPGLVDAHTHAHFLGDRAAEFCARAAGATYLELAQKGGGIRATVTATREGTAEARQRALRTRLARLLTQGVTTVEVKSGYGLSLAHELAFLEEISTVDGPGLPRVSATLLAAHAVPPEVTTEEQRAAWVTAICEELIPTVARRGLARRVDAFVEQSAYRQDEARAIAAATRLQGLTLHLHVDQLSAGGGAQLAAELGAQAAAHLERTSPEGVAALRDAGVVAVLLPTATFAAGEPQYAPARRLVEAGVPVALATNLNPGTGPTESTALLFFLAAMGLKLTPEEILWGVTRGGALALGHRELGLLTPAAPADLVLWNAYDLAHLPYHAAVNHVRLVLRNGQVVVDRSAEADRSCEGRL
jgi:imidazolonepropionase